ncbi:MAG: hypothetical protein H7Y02_03995 [Candidatus Obscuribacterales bacterium]|nr:hypothetical protein [Steroidobacteraceae bacterium]
MTLATTLLSSAAIAQQSKTKYNPPRMSNGKPSLEGAWTNATITPLQRPARYKNLALAPDEVEAATNEHPQVVRQKDDDKQDEKTVLTGADLGRGRGYNAFWIDPGMTFTNVKGEYRTSFVVDPPDGQIPFKSDARGSRREAREEGEAREVRGGFDGPEARPLGERCVVNSGSAGPPMLTYLYNNNYEIVQTPNTVAIRVEMNNYTRLIRIGGKHIPSNIRPLHGDSIGQWDGDTLVVETTNFHPHHANGMIGLTEQGKVTERFTRTSKNQILYEFTVEDATRYKQPWRAEYSFNATEGRVYEFACHEGNYALVGVLAGAREQEKRVAEQSKK